MIPKQRNKYRVPKSEWAKWTERGRLVFNYLMDVSKDQQLVSHPEVKLPKQEFRTTRWNMAWLAADAASHNVKARKPRIVISHMVPKGMFFARDSVLDLMRQAWDLGYAARMDQVG